MSYSFTVAADTKLDANRQIREQFHAVVVAQPNHAADQEAAVVAGQSLVTLLAAPREGEEICVNMSGSLSWQHDEFRSASLSVNAWLRTKEKTG